MYNVGFYDFSRHATIHEYVKKYQCSRCSFTCRLAFHLRRHERIHTGSKPFACPHCEYRCNNLVSKKFLLCKLRTNATSRPPSSGIVHFISSSASNFAHYSYSHVYTRVHPQCSYMHTNVAHRRRYRCADISRKV